MTRPHAPQNRHELSITAWQMHLHGEPIAEIGKMLRLTRSEVRELLQDAHAMTGQHQIATAQGAST